MATPANKPKVVVRRSGRKKKVVSMTKVEMLQKMIADQKFIREAIQSGISFKELRDQYGFKFTTV